MDEKTLHTFFGRANPPQLKHIETAEIWDIDELTLNLFRDSQNKNDWYVLIMAPAPIFLEDAEHVADLVEQSFMVDGISWQPKAEHGTPLPLGTRDYKSLVYSPDQTHHFMVLRAATDSPSLVNR